MSLKSPHGYTNCYTHKAKEAVLQAAVAHAQLKMVRWRACCICFVATEGVVQEYGGIHNADFECGG